MILREWWQFLTGRGAPIRRPLPLPETWDNWSPLAKDLWYAIDAYPFDLTAIDEALRRHGIDPDTVKDGVMAKYRIRHSCTPECNHRWKRPVTNFTGHSWFIEYPHPFKFTYSSTCIATSDGASFNTFEEARAYLARRLDDLHGRRSAAR